MASHSIFPLLVTLLALCALGSAFVITGKSINLPRGTSFASIDAKGANAVFLAPTTKVRRFGSAAQFIFGLRSPSLALQPSQNKIGILKYYSVLLSCANFKY
jgi:hypothetical protein